MELKDVEKLAKLSRIEISEEEMAGFLSDLTSILGYVKQIESVSTAELMRKDEELRNVMRVDADPHEPGAYSSRLLEEAPESQDGYVKVKQIISGDSIS